MRPFRVVLSTGDASGDAHAAEVVKALHALCQAHGLALAVKAVGGNALAALDGTCGVHLWRHHQTVPMGQVGLGGLLHSVPAHWRLGQALVALAHQWQPHAVVMVDYGGFHLRLAKALKRTVPVFHFIPPQVWGSRLGRIHTIKAFVQEVFTLFPFEGPLYERFGVPHTFVGHPLLSQLPPATAKATFAARHGLNAQAPWLALFPGSRQLELHHLWPPFLKTAALLAQRWQQQHPHKPPLQVVVAMAANLSAAVWQQREAQAKTAYPQLALAFVRGENHALLSCATAVLGASGTTTLEAALYGTPMVLAYKADPLTAWLARCFIKVPYLGLPNLLLPPQQMEQEGPVYPEFLQEAVQPEAMAQALWPLLEETDPQRQKVCHTLQAIRSTLGPAGKPTAHLVAERLLAFYEATYS
jgi:lipid-A-disaccharide synthase